MAPIEARLRLVAGGRWCWAPPEDRWPGADALQVGGVQSLELPSPSLPAPPSFGDFFLMRENFDLLAGPTRMASVLWCRVLPLVFKKYIYFNMLRSFNGPFRRGRGVGYGRHGFRRVLIPQAAGACRGSAGLKLFEDLYGAPGPDAWPSAAGTDRGDSAW